MRDRARQPRATVSAHRRPEDTPKLGGLQGTNAMSKGEGWAGPLRSRRAQRGAGPAVWREIAVWVRLKEHTRRAFLMGSGNGTLRLAHALSSIALLDPRFEHAGMTSRNNGRPAPRSVPVMTLGRHPECHSHESGNPGASPTASLGCCAGPAIGQALVYYLFARLIPVACVFVLGLRFRGDDDLVPPRT